MENLYGYDYTVGYSEQPPLPLIAQNVISHIQSGSSSSDAVSSEPVEDEVSKALLGAKIASHPLYPKLLHAYIDCQKVGASQEMVKVLEEIGEQNSGYVDALSFCGADPELDDFMVSLSKKLIDLDNFTQHLQSPSKESYCNLLVKFKSDLSRTFDEATASLNDLETQLNSLCVCNDGSSAKNTTDEATGSSEEELVNREEEKETIECNRINEDRELKDQLLLRYSGYIGRLKHQFSKNKKKEKLPKEALQILLAWWNIHFNWPYPTETDKVALAEWTGLDQKQINNWFINQRKRHWKLPTVEMQASDLNGLYECPSMND